MRKHRYIIISIVIVILITVCFSSCGKGFNEKKSKMNNDTNMTDCNWFTTVQTEDQLPLPHPVYIQKNSVTYLDVGNGNYLPISNVVDGVQQFIGDVGPRSEFVDSLEVKLPLVDDLERHNYIYSNGDWDFFPIYMEYTKYSVHDQPQNEKWIKHFESLISSKEDLSTPIIVSEVWSFDYKEKSFDIVTVQNMYYTNNTSVNYVEASNDDISQITPDAVGYIISEIFIDNVPVKTLYNRQIEFPIEDSIVYNTTTSGYYQNLFVTYQYLNDNIMPVDLFNNMSGEMILRDYIYIPKYYLCDIDGDEAVEIICYIENTSSSMSLCTIYEFQNQEIEKTFSIVPN